jgi:hypothetical protein
VRAVLALAVFLVLSGCGYVGPVLPPSPELPNTVNDLTAIERGDHILISFNTPPRTTDSLPIKSFSEIELRIGPASVPFDFNQWAAGAKPYAMPLPPPVDPDDPQRIPITQSIPASDWQGQRVAIAVRSAVKKKNHYSAWSNRVVLNVIAPLPLPEIKAQATAQGVALTWQAQGPAVKYRVYRQGPADNVPLQIGTAEQGSYLDAVAQFDIAYKYTVVAFQDSAESQPSKVAEITPLDKFAPSIPTAITALSSPNSIEVSWQRSPEPDLAGYYVYRSVNGSPFERQGNAVAVPTYSDHAVEQGKTYRYAISAVDKKNNESEKSTPAEAAY